MGILLNILIYILSSQGLAKLYGSRIDSIKQSIQEINTKVDIPELYHLLGYIEKMYEDEKFYLKEKTKDNFLWIGIITVFIIVPTILACVF